MKKGMTTKLAVFLAAVLVLSAISLSGIPSTGVVSAANQTVSCSDSDGGIVPAIFGTVTRTSPHGTSSFPDNCYNVDTVREFYCRGNSAKSVLMWCGNFAPNGICQSGRCIPAPFCGDAVINQASEQCDGGDFGSQTCQGFNYTGGSLTCTPDCTISTASCTLCGNGVCESGETSTSCPNDCDVTQPSASISVNNGAPNTTTPNVTLYLTFSDSGSGVKDCRYANEDLLFTGWMGCTATQAWSLSSGDGTKTVYYEVRDNALNIRQVSDTIQLLPPCTDTDGGFVVTVQGTATDATISRTDVCISSTTLNEFYCIDDFVAGGFFNCAGGNTTVCSSGRCL
ncbi:MAG: hypothetical protein HY518_03985 [Candidatus Aenigmarchaeota archaeon]|nr:hypothetical protein [Candidatus Aenigmarchaeota archaeon]